MALHITAIGVSNPVISIQLIGGPAGERVLDSDGIALLRITDKDRQTFRVSVKEGDTTTDFIYSLSGLILTPMG